MNQTELQSNAEIVLFGALGDLSRRKLLPALYQLDLEGLLHHETRIVGVARHEHSNQEFVSLVNESLNAFILKKALACSYSSSLLPGCNARPLSNAFIAAELAVGFL